jgi:hypothetical protein
MGLRDFGVGILRRFAAVISDKSPWWPIALRELSMWDSEQTRAAPARSLSMSSTDVAAGSSAHLVSTRFHEEVAVLRSIKEMDGATIGATDGIIGRVKDFYFDDEAWVIRYLVVDALEGHLQRSVLISPISIGQPNWSEKIFPVSLTREQVADSPDIDTDKPVSRQQEMGYLNYYRYGRYWAGGGLWGASLYPDVLQAGLQHRESRTDTAADAKGEGVGQHQHDDQHLRSSNAVRRYYVHASDGDLGHVAGFLVEEKSWAIRYLIVNTSNWWLGHEVLIAPQWIDHVDWAQCTLAVGLTREAIKRSPPYDSAASLDREQEAGIHTHYGRTDYWPREARQLKAEARL